MTPGARVAAAIEILDDIAAGLAAEQALTRWARRSRFAGSKDRAAIRDHIFDVLRSRNSAAHYGGGTSGHALMTGLCHLQGLDLGALFNGEGHSPAPLDAAQLQQPDAPNDEATVWNLPDWLIDLLRKSLGDDAAYETAMALQQRAPVSLRVNTAKTTVAEAVIHLTQAGIETRPNDLEGAALTITDGARKLRNSKAFLDGLVELQDAASQAVVAALPSGGKVLDYCAGGGGKALALAMDATRRVYAHDINPGRMRDLPVRAARAGAAVLQLETEALENHGPFDLVLCDAPCSGSGAWRRAAEGKWTLTPDRLTELTALQDDILDHAASLITETGTLAYATCSVLRMENEERVEAFLARNSGWYCNFSKRFAIDADGDGFFTAHLTQE